MTGTPRSARRLLGSVILTLELVVILLAGVTEAALGGAPATVWTVVGSLAALGVGALLLMPGLAGFVAGWLLQAGLIAAGMYLGLASMWVLGIVFLLVWAFGERQGVLTDRRRAGGRPEGGREADTLDP